MNTSFLKHGALAFGLVLLGTGCSAGPNDFAACFQETPWDSCVNFQGVDEALIGDWILVSEVVDTPVSTSANPTGVITNPFRGRTVTFGIAERVNSVTGELERYGLYGENYATETTDDATAGSVTSSCDVLGTSGGEYRSEIDVDLDAYDPDSSAPAPLLSTLKTYPLGQTVAVTCQATGEAVRSNRASTPFGVGKAELDSYGAHLPYAYTISSDWQTLIMTNTNSISNVVLTYTFTRN